MALDGNVSYSGVARQKILGAKCLILGE